MTGTGAPVAKKQLGNSIGSITTASLEKLPINSFSDLLAGREPGIVAFPSGGLTGEGAQIRIRGNASLSQLNEPIVIVDGIRVDRGGFGGGFVGSGGGGSTSRLDDINPESIERVEILKGASAATLFGTEASNGVIQILPKRSDWAHDLALRQPKVLLTILLVQSLITQGGQQVLIKQLNYLNFMVIQLDLTS